ncbi:protein of unknown function [Cyanobium sp. NIES-981]|nr:protein of unknown function [Cyanobium sp. NIES-981]
MISYMSSNVSYSFAGSIGLR